MARGHQEDERSYEIAIDILRQMGVDKVRLLTNNPEKVKSLEEAGFAVERATITAEVTPDNKAYLKAKADIAGHWL